MSDIFCLQVGQLELQKFIITVECQLAANHEGAHQHMVTSAFVIHWN